MERGAIGVRAASLAGLVTCTGLLLASGAVHAAYASTAGDDFVKYYVVTASYAGSPENLTEIAVRFLGSGARSSEIFNLNAGRTQPDGGMLSDPARVTAGWLMVMPWDAVGSAVKYGELPDTTPTTSPTTTSPTTAPTSSATSHPQPAASTTSANPPIPYLPFPGRPGTESETETGTGIGTGEDMTGSTTIPGTPDPGSPPTAASSPAPAANPCAGTATSTHEDWAALRLAPDQAWSRSRGKGQVVAVVDSGVDGTLPLLKGHVGVGRDMSDGMSSADVDCIGTGTAMAALIVAQPGPGSEMSGLAPDASVIPIRVRTEAAVVQPAVQAQAIAYAVGAGATVVALGPAVNTGTPEVIAAVKDAIEKDVVVVLGAPAATGTDAPDAIPGLLRVAAVGQDMGAADAYRKGSVDVVAPGVNVTSVGTKQNTGSGTYYAVAYAAGQAAVVRGGYPLLTAAQVTHRIEVTADRIGDGKQPDESYGWGMINPGASVTQGVPDEDAAQLSPVSADENRPSPGGGHTGLIAVAVLMMLAAAGYLGYRFWRNRRLDDSYVVAAQPPEAPAVVVISPPRVPAETGQFPSNSPSQSGGGHWTDQP